MLVNTRSKAVIRAANPCNLVTTICLQADLREPAIHLRCYKEERVVWQHIIFADKMLCNGIWKRQTDLLLVKDLSDVIMWFFSNFATASCWNPTDFRLIYDRFVSKSRNIWICGLYSREMPAMIIIRCCGASSSAAPSMESIHPPASAPTICGMQIEQLNSPR